MDTAIETERSLARILLESASARRRFIASKLYAMTGGRCLSGPFAGMRLEVDSSWGDGDLAPKLLGCYEQELHPALEAAIAREPGIVVDVGCAEGYDAVGLARRLPAARIHAFDLDAGGREICATNARLDQVEDRVSIAAECTPRELAAILDGVPSVLMASLVLMDCEGHERELVDPTIADALADTELIIELHPFVHADIIERLRAALSATHGLGIVREGARDPSAWPVLERLSSLDRWLTVCEFRPQVMRWLVARAAAAEEMRAVPPIDRSADAL